jgi:hypothetical protein
VDENWQVLRANPALLGMELKQDERDFVAGALAKKAGWLWVGHAGSKGIVGDKKIASAAKFAASQ